MSKNYNRMRMAVDTLERIEAFLENMKITNQNDEDEQVTTITIPSLSIQDFRIPGGWDNYVVKKREELLVEIKCKLGEILLPIKEAAKKELTR